MEYQVINDCFFISKVVFTFKVNGTGVDICGFFVSRGSKVIISTRINQNIWGGDFMIFVKFVGKINDSIFWKVSCSIFISLVSSVRKSISSTYLRYIKSFF